MLWPVQCLLRPLEHLLIQQPLLQGNDAFTRQRRGCSLSRAGEGPMRSGDRGRPSPGMQGSRRPRPHSRACTGLTWRDPDSPPQARTGFRNPPPRAPLRPPGRPHSPSRSPSREGHATSSAPAQPQSGGSVLRQRLSCLSQEPDRPLPWGNRTGSPRTPLQMPPVRDGGLGGLGSPRTTPHGALHSAAASPRRRTGAWAQTQGQLPHCFIPCFQGPVTISPLQRSDPALKINNVLTHTANPNEAELPRRGGLPREPAVTGAGGMSLPPPHPRLPDRSPLSRV